MTNSYRKDSCHLCPNCHSLPVISYDKDQDGDVLTFLGCKAHGHLACGRDLGSAIQNWNRYLSFICSDAIERSKGFEDRHTDSLCLFCERNTPSGVHRESRRYWVECAICHLIKWESAA